MSSLFRAARQGANATRAGLNLYSMVVATIGAAVFLVVYHGLFRGFRFRRRGFRFRGL